MDIVSKNKKTDTFSAAFTINSYIKYPQKKITDLTDVEQRPFYYFIHINNIEEIIRIKKQIDFNYIDGAICLTYNKKAIMDCRYYDLIDQLWSYILTMIELFLEDEKSEMSFPDQPLPMSMRATYDNYIIFSINFVEWKLPKHAFLNALLMGAKDFFEKIMISLQEINCTCLVELKKIKKLEQEINALKH